MTDQQRIERLERENQNLKRRLTRAAEEWKKAQRSRRDELTAAVIGGLAVRWEWEHTGERRLAEKCERLVDALMEIRRLRVKGVSPLDHQKPTKEAEIPTS